MFDVFVSRARAASIVEDMVGANPADANQWLLPTGAKATLNATMGEEKVALLGGYAQGGEDVVGLFPEKIQAQLRALHAKGWRWAHVKGWKVVAPEGSPTP